MNNRDVTLRFLGQVRKDARESLGQKRLADARGTHHGEVMSARCSDLKTVAGHVMATYISQVRVLSMHRRTFAGALPRLRTPQDVHHLRKRGCPTHPCIRANFRQTRYGHDDSIIPACSQNPRERASYGPEVTIQTEFTDEDSALEIHLWQLL